MYLDKIVAEFHGISAIILKFFKQLICRVSIVPASQIFQDVTAQEASLFFLHMLAQQIPCADTFQLKVLVSFSNSSINAQSAVTASQESAQLTSSNRSWMVLSAIVIHPAPAATA